MSDVLSADLLLKEWLRVAEQPRGVHHFRSRRVPIDGDLPVHLGVRSPDDAPCLLVEGSLGRSGVEFETGGVRFMQTVGHSGHLLALVLEDRGEVGLFATMCADLVAAASEGGRDDALLGFMRRLSAWREFLRERRGPSHAEIIGLMGELLVLQALLRCPGSSIRVWAASDRSLRDFVVPGRELEVKTSIGTGGRITVSTLDQLDETGLEHLFLAHVRLLEALDGATLGDLISTIEAELAGTGEGRSFGDALLRRGVQPDFRPAEPRVHLLGIDTYRVMGTFPRLHRATTPVGVLDARYDLDVRSLAPYSHDTDDCLASMIQSLSA